MICYMITDAQGRIQHSEQFITLRGAASVALDKFPDAHISKVLIQPNMGPEGIKYYGRNKD